MRILALTHNFPNEGNRNHGIFAARQFVEMKKQGAEIEVVVPVVKCPKLLNRFKRWNIYDHTWKFEYKDIKAINAPYIRLPGKWFRHFAFFTVFWAVKKKVLKMHKENPFDILYARFLFPEGYAAVRLSKILGIPVVGVGAGDEINVYPYESKTFKKDIIKVLLKLDAIITSGAKVSSNIEKFSSRKAAVIHGVVDLDEFSPAKNKNAIRKQLGLEAQKLTVLYLGTFKVAKGVHEMIKAFIAIHKKRPDVKFVICGYGKEKKKMIASIEEANASQAIKIMGVVDSKNVHKWMKSSDVFVLASYSEGMPNAVMEAMGCGLPIVATNVGGLPEEIGDCLGAILVEPHNPEAIEKALLKILDDDEIKNKMSLESRNKALQSFSIVDNVRKVLKLFQTIIIKA